MPTDHLPIPTTSFVGRVEELSSIAALLADQNCRLLTLVAAGGIGKTRLALQAAFAQIPYFAHGVYFVPLNPVHSTDLMAAAIASALQISLFGSEDPNLQIIRYLRDKQMLLVMDNFEHLLEGTRLLIDVLQATTGVKFIATSRERLNVQEEWVLELEGLPYPDASATDLFESYSAVQLFVQRARQVKSNFSLSQHAEAVKTICQRVEGMPLGLELAAAWLRVMSCQQIATQLEGNLDFLTTPLRNVPERHRSLRIVFDQSWNLLSSAEKNVLMRLSVFRGGFDLEASEQVADATISLSAGLTDKSLIRLNASGRYDMHELLRQYAADKLTESGEAGATERRHFAFFLSLAEQASQHYYNQAEKMWLDRLEIEHDNLRVALAWSLRNKKTDLGLNLAGALGWFWRKRFYRLEGRGWFEKLLAIDPHQPSRIRAKALYLAGILMSDLGDNHSARKFAEQALMVARTVGDQATIAWSLTILGHVTRMLEGAHKAAVLHEEALKLFRELGDWVGMNFSLRVLGRAVLYQHDNERAAALLEEAVSQAREARSEISVGHDLCLLGNITCHQNNLGRAKVIFQEALLLHQELRDVFGMTEALLGLASVARIQGDYDQARRYYKETLSAMNSNTGYAYSLTEALWGLGAVARAEGNSRQAHSLYYEALILNQGLDRWDTAYCLAGLAAVNLDWNEPERAAILFGAAAALFEHYRDLYAGDRVAFDEDVATARAQLSEATFEAAWAEGQAMTLEDAVAYVLEDSIKVTPVTLPEQADEPDVTQPQQAIAQPINGLLSAREIEIVRLMADGLSNAEIAHALYIALSTVKVHLRNIFSKLSVGSRMQAVHKPKNCT
jgi:predicted ATPase/DNA-binding CsgD family transcriptional regulator